MVSLHSTALRHILLRSEPCLRTIQRRWAQVHDVRFVASHPEPDRIIQKYREKLNKKAKEVGAKDICELKHVYKDKINSLKTCTTEECSPGSPFPPPPPPPQIPSKGHQGSQITSSPQPVSAPGIKSLSSFIDVPKILGLPQKQIEYLWRLRHASHPQSLCAAMPYPTYKRIESTARRHPQFILPLPRKGQGAEIHFLQWTFPSPKTTTVLFTHLAEYKLRGEFSQPHTTVTHYLELAGPKDLVLLQGSVAEGRGISVDEGKWLLMCLQKFYGIGEERKERKELLEQFSQGDGDFQIERLLEEAEKLP